MTPQGPHLDMFHATTGPVLLTQATADRLPSQNGAVLAAGHTDEIYGPYPIDPSSDLKFHGIASDMEPKSHSHHLLKMS